MNGFRAGLCTVSFRALSPAEVVACAAGAGVQALEWGGDVHVPHGDLAAADRAAALSADAGLEVVSYGSYLFLDQHVDADLPVVLDTAQALGAPGVRVWCAFGVEPSATDQERTVVTRAASTAAAAALDRGLTLTLEFHAGTLTADAVSARRLLDDVGSPVLFAAWQPPYWAPRTPAGEDADIGALAPDLAHVHVYDWDADLSRHQLERSEVRWARRLRAAAGAGERAERAGVPRSALVEFVPGDDPLNLATEVATLRRCLTAAGVGSVRPW